MITEVISNKTDFKRYIWSFYFRELSCKLVLRSYELQQRETKRHKWRTYLIYDGFDKRNNTIDIDKVPLPETVKEQAIKNFTQGIKVVMPKIN